MRGIGQTCVAAGMILKKGRSMYEVPAAKARMADEVNGQQSQTVSEPGTQQTHDSQMRLGSVMKPATPSRFDYS